MKLEFEWWHNILERHLDRVKGSFIVTICKKNIQDQISIYCPSNYFNLCKVLTLFPYAKPLPRRLSLFIVCMSLSGPIIPKYHFQHCDYVDFTSYNVFKNSWHRTCDKINACTGSYANTYKQCFTRKFQLFTFLFTLLKPIF